MIRRTLIAALLLVTLGASTASAETPEEKGRAVAREADKRLDGFKDYSATLTMTLKAKNGQEAVRELRYKSLETPGDGDKSLTLFDQPKDVEGTTLLTFAHKTVDDDIWLFLPALKRVKRIAGNNKSGPFMGSEFSFEDFGVQEVEKYTYKFLREDKLDGEDCLVIERVPVERTSGYSRTEAWFDKSEYRLQKIDYFNKNGAFLKTLRAAGYKKYLEQYWYPDRYEMINHDTGRSTLLDFKDYKFRNGFTERDFDQSALEAAR